MSRNKINWGCLPVSLLITLALLLSLECIVKPINTTKIEQDLRELMINHNNDDDFEDDFAENIEYKHVSSSTHHIKSLFNLERELV